MPTGTSPPLRLLLAEPARAALGLASFPLTAPWLLLAPRGGGQPVLVLPGYLASDRSTVVIRGFLRRMGYQVQGWAMGRNDGAPELLDEAETKLREMAAAARAAVSVVGWSLGGLYARELARRQPNIVRQVITLGSPLALERRAGRHDHPVPVPVTTVYSRSDGIVEWQGSVAPSSPSHQCVEVRCGHLGFSTDPATLWLLTDRLAQSDSSWTPYHPPARLRALYGSVT
ncbi:MAG: esterase/lipase family protein [Acidimicrobiales bacterium]